jgi:hypothetical protein
VFQRSLPFESSRGTLKMEVVYFFITVSIPVYFVTVEGNNPIAFLDSNEVTKWRRNKVWC